MQLFEYHSELPHPADEVFALTADLENAPHWHRFFKSVRQVSPGPIGVETRWQVDFLGGGFSLQVTEFEPPHRLVFRGSRVGGVIPNFTIEVKPAEGGSHVRYVLHPDVPALLRPIISVFGPPFGRWDLNRYFRHLDAALERAKTANANATSMAEGPTRSALGDEVDTSQSDR